MIRNFFKSAFRNLWKTKGYSFLNIFGLAVGVTAAALIFLWVESQITKDDHFPDKKDIYVVKSIQKYDGATNIFESTPGPFAQAAAEDISGIKHIARTDWGNWLLFSVDDNGISQSGHYADPSLLDILSVEFKAGDKRQALSELNNVVLSESAAKRLFGNGAAVGQTVRVNNEESYTVTGVIKDLPKNSSFKFDWLINFKKFELANPWLENWNANGLRTIVQLQPEASLSAVNATLLDFAKLKTSGETAYYQNFLYPMSRWTLYNSFDNDGMEREGAIKNIRLFSIIAWVVLLIACINFMNLATARSEKRAKEVGMRKVVGAKRHTLILQFLSESMISAFFAVLFAIGLIYLAIGPFNTMLKTDLSVRLFEPLHLYFLLGIVVICGLLAGSYPAFYLSSFNPLKTLKGAKQNAGTAGLIRRGLVIVQYTASILLVICTVIIYQQIQHTKNRDIGFERSQVITTSLQGDMAKKIHLIKDQLIATGDIESVGVSDNNIMNIGSNASGFDWDGKAKDSQVLISILNGDEGLIPSLSMQLHDGRNFKPQLVGDSTALIINETLARMIKRDGLVAGQTLHWNNEARMIVGVVKDFVYNDVFSSSPEPLIISPTDYAYGQLYMKTKAGIDLPEMLVRMEKIIKANNPAYPVEYKFLDETFDRQFSSVMMIQHLATVFAVLSIIISCLGLFGLASFSAQQRAKEISIRKVLGASITRLVSMLNREFVVLVGLSCLIAFPLGWWFMHDWLGNYKYRIDISWIVFALAAGLAIAIAILTVSTQALRAATANPTKTLKNE
ncbi:ABC transporter permease [Sphingobacterium sp. lm-10]|uniref:ABC transporter permease n=1 Tax=Sphingobacterium sp. lm-10 TaxID=2944904 RepID=UPI0020210712|nr:ABC transporter permease [Sphingobacterium sp. lm-10]MCL7988088.1 ABC transporter permease [Sphingobacterium sp. lm-10]